MGWNGSMVFMLFLAMDRLLSVVFPIWHNNVNTIIYTGIMTTIGLCYCLYIILMTYKLALQTPNNNVISEDNTENFQILSDTCRHLMQYGGWYYQHLTSTHFNCGSYVERYGAFKRAFVRAECAQSERRQGGMSRAERRPGGMSRAVGGKLAERRWLY
ncbi:hypothetical protein DdX_16838 [Ditylenchus destructor]|uniref:G-protein coupled receptors family 1 profile domain-containing protein n=1 Tax=Ditylenchus destructor TaxID=166010 RepID=A0AAD4QWC3_9BILA|nr:hypothetical protein DdX_16838 [Ditylenchus destructor]